MSSLWYFIAVWVGSKKVLGKFEALLRNYLWSIYENTIRVSWDDCTLLKKIGGLDLTSSEEIVRAFMDYSSTSHWPNKFASFVEVQDFLSATFLPWFVGFIICMVVLPDFSSQRWVKSLASHCLNMEGDGANNCSPLPINNKGCFATQYLVEG